MRIFIGIPCATWIPERKASLATLLDSVPLTESPDVIGRVNGDRSRVSEIMPNTWDGALESGADFCTFLEDDARVAPDFLQHLRKMVDIIPPRAILGLASQHPLAREAHEAGCNWFRTQCWIVGWAYGMWRRDLEELRAWHRAQPRERIEAHGNDHLVNCWGWETGRFVWHPTPTIATCDDSLVSSVNGTSGTINRSSFTWRDVEALPESWELRGSNPHLEFPCEAEKKGLAPGYWRGAHV